MILERSKNTKRNSFWGILNNIVTIIFPFAVRTVMIKELGTDYLGLNSLFTSILMVLNITESGFGSVMEYSMYKPLAEDNTDLICSLLKFYKKIYRIIGLFIFCSGCCLIPFLNYFIHGDIPSDINIYILYLLYLGNTAMSYWLFVYKNSILIIYQRNDIKSKIMIVLDILMYCSQIFILIFTHNYYMYVLILLLFTVCNNIVPAIYIKKTYPQYVCKGKISSAHKKNIKTNVSGLIITRLASITRNSFDSIIISAFLGLTAVAVYNNYYYIMNAVARMLIVLTTAISAGVGNSIATDTPEKNLEDMKIINFWYMWIAGWFTICLGCLYQPFMQIWVGKSFMLSDSIMWMFAIYFLFSRIGDIQGQYFDAAGLWWHRRWYSLGEALSNIVLNLILGYYFGIAGIIMATILSIFFINFLGSSKIIFKHYYKHGFKTYLREQIFYICITIGVSFITSKICNAVTLADTTVGLCATLFVRAVICIIIPNILFLLVYRKTSLYKKAYPWLKCRMKISNR